MTFSVPKELKGKTAWAKPMPSRKLKKGQVKGRFVLDTCTQKELEYLNSLGIGISKD